MKFTQINSSEISIVCFCAKSKNLLKKTDNNSTIIYVCTSFASLYASFGQLGVFHIHQQHPPSVYWPQLLLLVPAYVQARLLLILGTCHGLLQKLWASGVWSLFQELFKRMRALLRATYAYHFGLLQLQTLPQIQVQCEIVQIFCWPMTTLSEPETI